MPNQLFPNCNQKDDQGKINKGWVYNVLGSQADLRQI